MTKPPIDPYRDSIVGVPWQCEHGHGANCECQLPMYKGLYVTPMLDARGKTRHVVVRMQLAHDGGMVQFIDPLANKVVGSCGIHWMYENVHTIESFKKIYDDRLPIEYAKTD